MRCPCCGANLIYNREYDLFSCEYCGHVERVVTRVVERSEAPVQTYRIPTTQTAPKTNKASGLAVTALILAIIPLMGFWGMLLGCIDLSNSKKKGEPQQAISVIAVVWGMISWMFGLIINAAILGRM